MTVPTTCAPSETGSKDAVEVCWDLKKLFISTQIFTPKSIGKTVFSNPVISTTRHERTEHNNKIEHIYTEQTVI